MGGKFECISLMWRIVTSLMLPPHPGFSNTVVVLFNCCKSCGAISGETVSHKRYRSFLLHRMMLDEGWNFFFIPGGRQPPAYTSVLMVPVYLVIIILRVYFWNFRNLFKSILKWAAIQATKCPVLSYINMMVCKHSTEILHSLRRMNGV